ncbi:MAG TPA: TIGR03364 family FAD-dependent oxidoreductase [Puia sp.]|nr:TIGR03364 family FAD-dependent oxidoreductase [Puia sp.]
MPGRRAIVIGAGIVGLATARALAIKGYAVEVFERGHQALGASVRNFGMIWPIGQPQGKLYQRAMRARECWVSIGDHGALWYDPVGSLHVACQPDEWQVLQELYEGFRGEGRCVKLLNRDELLELSPIAHRKNCIGGLYSEEEIIVDPRKALAALPGYLEETYGVKFHWGRTVTHCATEQVLAGSKLYNADLVFICSGADFETLYPQLFSEMPITKCKLQMMRLEYPEQERIGPALCGALSLVHYASFRTAASLPVLHQRFKKEMPEYLHWGIHVMVSQQDHGQLTVGDSHEYGLSPDPFDRQFINKLILDYLQSFTQLPEYCVTESWNGVYPRLTDGNTELFLSPEPGVYIINAVGGAGMTLSFGLAEELVNEI